MAHKKRKHKKHKGKKKLNLWMVSAVVVAVALIVAFFAVLFFVSKNYSFVAEGQISVSSESPQQGDTVLVKVSGSYPEVLGYFSAEKVSFFRNNKYSDWYALLGVDASLEPGEYSFFVDVPGKRLEKQIIVEEKDFPSTKMAIPQDLQNKGYTASTVMSNIAKNDNPTLEDVFKNFTPEPYFTSAFSEPLQGVSQSGFGFGEIIKFTGYEVRHFGIDLRANMDTKVFAVNDGKVVMAKDLSNYGKTIIIDHGLGIFSLYLHLDQFNVQERDMVKNSQVIGLSGNTGYAVGPHLHFSIRNNGAKIDPVEFVEKTAVLKPSSSLASMAGVFSRFLNSFMSK